MEGMYGLLLHYSFNTIILTTEQYILDLLQKLFFPLKIAIFTSFKAKIALSNTINAIKCHFICLMVHNQLKKYSNLFRNFICSIGSIFYGFPRIQKDSIEICPIEGLKKDHMRVFSFFLKIYGLETIYGKFHASTPKCSGWVVLGL